MLQTVKDFIERHHLFSPADRLLVAVSGGADSVALLCALQKLGYATMEVAHCNFQLRGAESDRDEDFVRRLCARMDVPLHVQRFDTAAYAKAQGVSIEMAAREMRYEWFERLRQERGCACVAVAHHREDQAETVLLNLLRGTGLRGLAGMRPRNGHVVRPMLSVPKAGIDEFLKQQGQEFVTDSTNLQDLYARNRIRHQVLPLLRQLNPAAIDNLLTTSENLAEAEKMYSFCASRFVSSCLDSAETIHIETLLKAPSPLCVLHEILSPFGFNRPQLLDILRCLSPRPQVGRVFHSPKGSLLVDREHLVLRLGTGQKPQSGADGSEAMIDGCQLSDFCQQCAAQGIKAHLCVPPRSFFPSPKVAYLDAAKLHSCAFTLRRARRGDTFVPFGMTGSKLVSDFLTDQKATRFEKETQRVLLIGGEIAWVVGRRSSDLFRVDAKTKSVLVLEVE